MNFSKKKKKRKIIFSIQKKKQSIEKLVFLRFIHPQMIQFNENLIVKKTRFFSFVFPSFWWEKKLKYFERNVGNLFFYFKFRKLFCKEIILIQIICFAWIFSVILSLILQHFCIFMGIVHKVRNSVCITLLCKAFLGERWLKEDGGKKIQGRGECFKKRNYQIFIVTYFMADCGLTKKIGKL